MGKGKLNRCICKSKKVLSWGDEKFLALNGAISESSLLWISSLCLNGVSLNSYASDINLNKLGYSILGAML
jgi:hypothetical protein